MPEKVFMFCRNCGSQNVERDASAIWNQALRCWELGKLRDYGHCLNCKTEGMKLIKEVTF